MKLVDLDYKNHIGICPVSGYNFAFEGDEQSVEKKQVLTTRGLEIQEDWHVTPMDGDGG